MLAPYLSTPHCRAEPDVYKRQPLTSPTKVMGKIRNRAPYAAATLIPQENGTANIQLEQPQRAITKGQSAVCYQGEAVIAGGVIIE